jgi:PAT family beta-lactamase induction signal transducer AmpG
MLQIIENFSVTFSLTAYSMVLFYVVRNSRFKTAHYAFLAGIMVASVMIPSMFSGAIEQALGYKLFFVFVMFTMIPSLFVLPFIRIEKGFGKRVKADA